MRKYASSDFNLLANSFIVLGLLDQCFVVFSELACCSSLRASAATHLAALESDLAICFAVRTAALLRAVFLLAICLKAQFTAFFTKFLWSEASLMINGRNRTKVSFDAFLSWNASSAISTKPARLMYSSGLRHHSMAFRMA